MRKTTVVNIYKDRNYDEYIGRAGHGQSGYFGNPFSKGTREENIKLFRAYAKARMKTDLIFRRRVLELEGKILGCFCAPLPCHGDVYIEIIKQHEITNSTKTKSRSDNRKTR